MKSTAMHTIGYIYGIILRVLGKNLTAEEAVELIREMFVQ